MEDILPYLQYLIYALVIAILVAAGVGGKALVKMGETFLKSKLGASNFDLLKAFATAAVRAIEQTPEYQELVGPEKKEVAVEIITDFAYANHLPVSEALVSLLVEAAVQVMNGEKPDFSEIAEVVGVD